MAMKPEIKSQWVEALRSGEYSQGVGSLRSPDNTFCCLGVLCDLYSKAEGVEWEAGYYGIDSDPSYYSMHDRGALPPTEVAKWAGMSSLELVGELSVPADEAPVDLVSKNDSGISFEEIADMIERYL